MSSRRSSSKKKEDTSLRIKISSNKKNKSRDEEDENDEDFTVEDSDTEDENVDEEEGSEEEDDENGEDDDEKEIEKRLKKSRGPVSYNKRAFSMPDDISKLMNRILCCSCGKQLNPSMDGAIRRHPWLKVVCCRKCYKFLKSGPFTRDSEGVDEQCRWCGDGGRLYGCDYCKHCFCRSCIKRNMGRGEAGQMENEDGSKWKCYMCAPKKVAHLKSDCKKILRYIASEDKREKDREERARKRVKEKLQKIKEEKGLNTPESSESKQEVKKEQTVEIKQELNNERNKGKEGTEVKKEKEDTPQRSTRTSSRIKVQNVSKESTPQKTPQSTEKKKSENVIVIDDSPAKPKPQPVPIARPGSYTNPVPSQGVKGVTKLNNGVMAVTVGPKPKPPPKIISYNSGNIHQIDPHRIPNNPVILPILNQSLQNNLSRGPQITVLNNTDKVPVKVLAPLNDINSLKLLINQNNIENMVDKMTTVATSLNLLLNSVKTDLAIAKLSSTNMFLSRNSACYSLKTGLDSFFNNMREVFNLQFKTVSPTLNATDVKTSTPIADRTGVKHAKMNVSTIPIYLDDSDSKEGKAAGSSKDDDTCMVVSDGEEDTMEVDDDEEEEEDEDEEGEDIDDNYVIELNASHSDDAKKVSDSDEIKKSEKSEDKDKFNGKPKKDNTVEEKKKDMKNDTKSDKTENKDDNKADKSRDLNKSKNSSKEKIDEISDSKDKKKDDKSLKESDKSGKDGKHSDGENTAAELELLKEMADELNETKEDSSPEKEKLKSKKGTSEKEESLVDDSKSVRSTRLSRSVKENDTKSDKDKSLSSAKKSSKDSDEEENKSSDSESVDSSKHTPSRSRKSRSKTSEASKEEKKDESRHKSPKKSLTSKSTEKEESKDESISKSSKKSKMSKGKEYDDSDSEKTKQKSKDNKNDSKADSDCQNDDDESESQKRSSRPSRSSRKSLDSSGNKNKDSKGGKVKSSSKEAKDIDKENLEAEKQLLSELAENEESSGQVSDASDIDTEKEPKQRSSKKQTKSESPRKSSSSRRESKSTKSKSKKEEEEDPGSDSSNYDPDLEKEIKSLTKDTKFRPRRACATQNDKDKKGKKKGASRSGKGASSQNESDEDDIAEGPENEDDDDDNTEVDDGGESSETSQSRPRRSNRSQEKEEKGKKKVSDKKSRDAKGKKKSILEDLSSNDEEEAIEADEEDEDEEEEEPDIPISKLRKLKANQKKALDSDDKSDDSMEEEGSCDSSDPDISFPKMSRSTRGKKEKEEKENSKKGSKKGKGKSVKDESAEDSDDSDFLSPKKKKKKLKDDLLDAKLSDSDSDLGKKGKKGKAAAKKRKRKQDSEEEEEEAISDEEDDGKKKKGKGKGKKRRRIKKVSSSESEKEPGADDDLGLDNNDDDDDEHEMVPDGKGGFMKRKKIRKVQTNKKLKDETKAARKAEEERRKRIEDRQKEYNSYVEVEGGEEEIELPEGTERAVEDDPTSDTIAKILGPAKKVPITTKCILEMNKDKKPLIEIEKTLVRKLKPHQVEAVRFMFNCCVESIERMKKGEESGCILAHCMGLGKTLSVISFLHTMLRNTKHTKMTKCLVVCPLNTVLNWVNEFEIWLGDVDYEIEVFEMSKVKPNFERAQMLKEWHESSAGVMILGYDMYRNLVQGSHCKNKKQKKIFYETLADPGPDIVVCDEGHILKNDQTSLSKAMNKIKSKRRIVLTGTPLQNNLGEYHCMVNFVKPSLLGTRKEFANRFVNPITNGQCTDSSQYDVKLMKRRAHILHELLAGCVQRKDYSALTKFLPPKFEYVVSVRLATKQMEIYQKYLDLSGMGTLGDIQSKGARLFKDYQALMRIWTHPWVLKLDEIRQENKKMYDDSEDSFIDDSSDEEDSFIDDGSTTPVSDVESDSNTKKKKKRKRRGRGASSSSGSDSDNDKKNDGKNEVVKKWTSRRRGNEEGAGSSWMDLGYAQEGPKEVSTEWWAEYVKEEDEYKLELSGKLMLLFEILKMCEDIGDKVLVFSQSLLSLDIIEDFLHKIDEANNGDITKTEEEDEAAGDGENKDGKAKTDDKKKKTEVNGEVNGSGDKEEKKEEDPLAQYGKSWTKGADYFRMDGSTSSHHRKAAQDMFNDPENFRSRLFLISTKAGSLGINLVAANRVIIFDASWNPSHDIQSIFRVYRFGQVKPVYVYRFLAQGTMEEKIYERQVTKQSLSQRVVDEHQIERHFTSSDLQELYKFTPDRLDDPERKERPLPMLPKDHMLAELMSSQKEWIVTFHEHDSLLENKVEQELSEEEKKAAWEDYEEEKKGRPNIMYQNQGGMYNQQSNLQLQNLMMHGSANLGQQAVIQIVQDLKSRFPHLPPDVFQQRVQAVLRQVLTQQIMQQTEMQRRQLDQQKMNELNRLNQLKQQIQQQQAMVNNQQQVLGMSNYQTPSSSRPVPGASGGYQFFQSGLSQQMLALSQRLKGFPGQSSGSASNSEKKS